MDKWFQLFLNLIFFHDYHGEEDEVTNHGILDKSFPISNLDCDNEEQSSDESHL